MIVLLGFAALAIDLGSGYLERRRMRGHFAVALAGAYAICDGRTDAEAITIASLHDGERWPTRPDIRPGDIVIGSGEVSVVKRGIHGDQGEDADKHAGVHANARLRPHALRHRQRRRRPRQRHRTPHR